MGEPLAVQNALVTDLREGFSIDDVKEIVRTSVYWNDFATIFEIVRKDLVLDLATHLGLVMDTTIDNFIGLIYLLNISGKRLPDIDRTRELCSLTHEELAEHIPDYYSGPRDYLSYLFFALTGVVNDFPEPGNEKYQDLLDFPPFGVVATAIYLYDLYEKHEADIGIHDGTDPYGFISTYHPYLHVSLRESSPIEPYILNLPDMLENVVESLGIVFPSDLRRDKVQYILENIKDYEMIPSRSDDIPYPPDISKMTNDQAKTVLSEYMDKELIDAYGPDIYAGFGSRSDLIDTIIDENQRQPLRWALVHSGCKNEESKNIVTSAEHKLINKDEKFTVSYGSFPNGYNCYQLDELIMSFRNDGNDIDSTFRFFIPDSEEKGWDKVFPEKSIVQLISLLKSYAIFNPNAEVKEFIEHVEDGIRFNKESKSTAAKYAKEIRIFTKEEKNQAGQYFVWIFLFGMYNRFWNGPGDKWPYGFKDKIKEGCDQDNIRTVLITEFIPIRANILNSMSERLKKWILGLRAGETDWETGKTRLISNVTDFHDNDVRAYLDTIINKLADNDFCQAHASDIFISSGYYYLTKIAGLSNDEFNKLVKDTIQFPQQKDFNPKNVEYSHHIEPKYKFIKTEYIEDPQLGTTLKLDAIPFGYVPVSKKTEPKLEVQTPRAVAELFFAEIHKEETRPPPLRYIPPKNTLPPQPVQPRQISPPPHPVQPVQRPQPTQQRPQPTPQKRPPPLPKIPPKDTQPRQISPPPQPIQIPQPTQPVQRQISPPPHPVQPVQRHPTQRQPVQPRQISPPPQPVQRPQPTPQKRPPPLPKIPPKDTQPRQISPQPQPTQPIQQRPQPVQRQISPPPQPVRRQISPPKRTQPTQPKRPPPLPKIPPKEKFDQE